MTRRDLLIALALMLDHPDKTIVVATHGRATR